jgi:DNA-binding transcriptional LysR family regulator
VNSLSSLYLDAFAAVAQTKNFSRAAEKIHITQSALSQRVLKLEEELEATLFIRDRAGVQLTEVGHELLRYCQSKEGLEEEFLSHIRSKRKNELSGEIRIGAFSSVARSVILPSLSSLLRENPLVRLNLLIRELRDLPDLLRRGEIDLMILDHRLDKDGLEAVQLGFERNVLVQKRGAKVPEIYLDHDEEDLVTRKFLKISGKKVTKLERRYLDDVYGLLDGVRYGIGRAVLPRHLLSDEKDLVVLDPSTELKIPVVVHFYTQPYYTRLHTQALESLQSEAPKIL